MTQITKFLRKILAARYAGLLVLVTCIAAKSILICYYSYIGRDKMFHLSASYNLLHGKGWTNSVYYTDHLEKEVREHFCLWPPGYGLMVAPVEYLVKDDFRRSTDIIEILSFIAFLLLCRGILSTQKMSGAWLNASTILLSFFSHDFIEASLGTDLPGLCFMLGFFYCSLLLWQTSKPAQGNLLGSIAGLCLFMAGFIRYMYVPVAITVPVIMVAAAQWKKNKTAVRGYWICLLLASALLGAAAWFQGTVCADPFYIGTDKKSLFADNLYYWHPAALAAFLNIDVYGILLERLTKIPFLSWRVVFNWINLFVYASLVVAGIRYLPVLKRSGTKDFPFFRTMGFLLSAAVIGELAILSLTNSAKYSLTGDAWTFIIEGRYHAFPVVFFQLFFLTRYSEIKDRRSIGRIRGVVMTGLFSLLCINSVHQFYFTIKVMAGFHEMKKNVAREADYDFVEDYLRLVIKENPGKEVLITSSDDYYTLMGSVLGAKGVKDYPNIHAVPAKTSHSSILLVVMAQPELPIYRSFIAGPGVQLVKEINGTYIYRKDIR